MKSELQILSLRFGALSPSIEQQLIQHGFNYNAETVEHFQLDADAVIRLSIRGLLPDSQKRILHKKLMRRISAHVLEHAKGITNGGKDAAEN